MASREPNHLSISIADANSTSLGGLPSPTNSEHSFLSSTSSFEQDSNTVASIPHPNSLSIPLATFPTGQRTHLPTLLRQRSFPGTEDNETSDFSANMNRRPSLPDPHYHPMVRQPSYDPRRQPGYPGGFHFYRQSNQDQYHRIGRPLTPQSPTSTSPAPTDNSNEPAVRHPLWKLECRQCSTLLCEQAMQGHLVGDPSQRLFSTNLAIGGTMCGYSLTESCTSCRSVQSNEHSWIFYDHDINAHWRTLETGLVSSSPSSKYMFWDDLPSWTNDGSESIVGR